MLARRINVCVQSSAYVLMLIACLTASAMAGDWNQWRGPGRNGVADDSPELIDSLPAEGLRPLWVSKEKIPGGGDGGWSSPIVAAGRVYLFAHFRTAGVKTPEAKYPPLSPEEQKKLDADKLAEYEKNRLEEQKLIQRGLPYEEAVYCFDVKSGEQLWKNQRQTVHTTFPHSSTPAIVDGKLYVLAAGMEARCLDANTGSDLWEARLPGEFTYENLDSSFALVGDVAVVLAEQLTAIDRASGEIRWQLDKKKAAGRQCSPVVWKKDGRDLLIVSVAGGETICVDPADGNELWRIKSESEASTPVIVGDRMITFGSSRKKGLRCFELSTEGARHLWTFQYAADPGSSPLVLRDRVFVQGEQRLACVNLETGKALWRTQIDATNPRYTSLVAADDKVFYVFDGLLMFDAGAKKFQPLINAKLGVEAEWQSEDKLRDVQNRRQPLQCASPAIAEGLLFVRLNDGLACYDLKESRAMADVAANATPQAQP